MIGIHGKSCKKRCQFMLVEELGFALGLALALDDGLARGIMPDDTILHCIQHGGAHLVVEVHHRLPLVVGGVLVQDALVLETGQVGERRPAPAIPTGAGS